MKITRLEELPQRLETLLTQSYTQLNAWSLAHEYALRISKKGKVLLQETLSKGAVMTTLNHTQEAASDRRGDHPPADRHGHLYP